MPRPLKPPLVMLKLEALSDGRDPRLVDDFTGEALAQPYAQAPDITDPQALRDQMNQAKLAQAQVLLVRVGLGAGEAPKAKALPKRPLRRL